MSSEQSEINALKMMLAELSERVESKIIEPQNIQQKLLIEHGSDSEMGLRLYELENKITELSKENEILQQEIIGLKKDNSNLNIEKNGKEKKINYYVKQIQEHEKKNRKLFEYYSADKEEVFKYQLLVKKLQQEIFSLEEKIEKQEERYENLKNQLSYRFGSRLVGIKKSKDLLKLPKTLLEDYVAVKSKINKSNALSSTQRVSQTPLLPYIGNRQYSTFETSVTLPLRSKLSSVVFKRGFRGLLELELYGVKPSTSVEIELTIRAYQNDCVFRIMPDLKHIHHLSANESMKTHVTIDDSHAHQFMNIISLNGAVEVAFKKTRGVPSFFHLYSNNDNQALDQLKQIVNENKNLSNINQYPVTIPKLKQKNSVFIEAWELNKDLGFKVAETFVKKYAPTDTHATLSVMQANNYLNEEVKWVDLINEYITEQNLQPITLRPGKEAIFHRITSKVNYVVEEPTKISVIMPAFNADKTIELSMYSILKQTWKNLELIVINDCSTDNTLSVIQRVAESDNRVKIIDNPANVGAYVSKNLGLKLATGSYITGHDADDWAHPQRLEKHIRLIQSEEKPPRASITRMIRMEEDGFFRMYKISTFCHDGILRIASITCMFEADFLRNTLGGWDCARFGADSEIISRSKMVLGNEFKNYQVLSMICLDEPTSLTNDPVHGVSKTTGISPTRKFYKEQWETWHKTLSKDNVYLEFPHFNRSFKVPEGTEVPENNILSAINNLKKYV